MKRLICLAVPALAWSITPPAWADVKLTNKDGKAHEISIKCGSSTTQTSIGANTTRSIGKGPCTVTIKGTGGQLQGGDGAHLTIEKIKK